VALVETLEMDGRTIGAVIGVAFGWGWGVAGATVLPPPWHGRMIWFSLVVSGVLVAALGLFGAHRPMGTFHRDVYGIALTFEIVGIMATVWLLRKLGGAQFLVPAIGFIVGLPWTRSRSRWS
jgi:hypothetical protein